MKLKKIIRATSYYDLTPYDESELIEEVKSGMEHIIVSLVTADIKVTSAMFKMAAKKDLLGLLKLIPNVTEQVAAYIIDGSIIGFNLQEDMFDEAIDAAKDLKSYLIKGKVDE